MNDQPELMNLFWSNAGIYPGTGDISPVDFEVRVKSASKAGFKGIGVWHTDLEHILVHRTLEDMRAILADNDIRYLELEFLTDWFVAGQRKADSDSRKQRLFEASAALGARHVKVGDFYNTPAVMPRLIDSFGALCADAARFGARVGFEFMASSMLPSLRESLAMIEAAGASNGGVIVDIVHVVTLGIGFDEVSRIPLRNLVSVELNDGYPPADPRHDRTGQRKFCGEGAYDIKGFIAAVRKTGFVGPWAVEVFAHDIAGLPQDEVNRRAFETTLRQFNP
jgi:sugar phosphate isomerase/epimerase